MKSLLLLISLLALPMVVHAHETDCEDLLDDRILQLELVTELALKVAEDTRAIVLSAWHQHPNEMRAHMSMLNAKQARQNCLLAFSSSLAEYSTHLTANTEVAKFCSVFQENMDEFTKWRDEAREKRHKIVDDRLAE